MIKPTLQLFEYSGPLFDQRADEIDDRLLPLAREAKYKPEQLTLFEENPGRNPDRGSAFYRL